MTDFRIKKNMIRENILACKFGIYKNLTTVRSIKCFYNDNYNIAPPFEYATVEIKMQHPIDVAYSFLKIGFKPVIINFVSYEFTGGNIESNDGIKDEMMNIRTSFNKTINPLNSLNLFPLKDSEVIYAPIVYIIRNSNLQLIYPTQVCNISMITAPIKKEPELMQNNLSTSDYILIKQTIETIFQTANAANNDVIILNDCGVISCNYPIDDIIDIINSCIYKYGHLFKFILIAIFANRQNAIGYCNKFDTSLIKPQTLLEEGKILFNINKYGQMNTENNII